MTKKIAVIRGDGIGPEVVNSTLKVLDSLGLDFEYVDIDAGYGYFEKNGVCISEQSLELCRQADAGLYGANTNPPGSDGYKSLSLTLRKELDLFANVRPAKSYPVPNIRKDIDVVIVRENTEGMYSQLEQETPEGVTATRVITKKASKRIIEFAFNLAKNRTKKTVTIAHKANVLEKSCGLFREIGFDIAKKFPDITTNDMFIDAMAMDLIRRPEKYDVIVTTNLFGDILSDEASALVGGLGMAPAGNIGENNAIFEPVHGSAPDIAGKGIANPIATILAAKMMLEHLGLNKQAEKIENAVIITLKDGQYTQDLGGRLTTAEITQEIIRRL